MLRSGPAVEPCPERLHEISGHLLLYYSANGRLPGSLADLRATVGRAGGPPLACPASGEPYLYDPTGLPVPGQSGRLVLYDAAPAHRGMRWGILLGRRKGNEPLAARVVLLPEESILAAEREGHP